MKMVIGQLLVSRPVQYPKALDMKRILSPILELLADQCEASMIPLLSGSPPSPILFQDALTYANASEAASAGWTNSGSPGWGNTSGPGSLSGSAALLSSGAGNSTTSVAFSGHTQGRVYIYLKKWAVATNANEQVNIAFRTAAGSTMFEFRVRSSATRGLRIQDTVGGGVSTSPDNAYADNTVYPLRIYYTPGNGSNGIIGLDTSSDGVTWTNRTFRSNSTAQGFLGILHFSATTSSSTYAQGLYVSTANYTPTQLAALP